MREDELVFAESVGRWLRMAREDAGLSIAVVAKRAELSESTIRNAERGQRVPRLESLIRIVGCIGIRIEDLIASVRNDLPERCFQRPGEMNGC
jgi:transcriptional regulator with XRE-family HTH domain